MSVAALGRESILSDFMRRSIANPRRASGPNRPKPSIRLFVVREESFGIKWYTLRHAKCDILPPSEEHIYRPSADKTSVAWLRFSSLSRRAFADFASRTFAIFALKLRP